MQKLLVSTFLRMAGPSQFETAEEVHTNEYKMDTPGNVAIAIGAYTGTRDIIQDLDPKYRGQHYAVIASFVFA